MFSVGRNVKEHPAPTLCHGQRHLPLNQVTQILTQPGIELLQDRESTATRQGWECLRGMGILFSLKMKYYRCCRVISQACTTSVGGGKIIKNFFGQGGSHSTGPVLQSLSGQLPHCKYSDL